MEHKLRSQPPDDTTISCGIVNSPDRHIERDGILSSGTQPRVRRLFPGGNTCRGFYSFYDQIIPADAARIFIIKGGPGVGKSSFMRAVAREMIGRGYGAELMQCSSDNGSLDGVVFPEIRVALIDGTAPHVVDPRNPGCVDEIVHLGDYWDVEGMIRGKERIMALNREVGRLFARAYRFLRAAKEIRDDRAAANSTALDRGRANRLAAETIHRYIGPRRVAAVPGRTRRLFASAITPDGPLHYMETIFGDTARLVTLTGRPGTGKSTLLAKVAQAAVERGLDCECFHCGFDPERLEHLYLPALGLGLVTCDDYHQYGAERAELTLDMGAGRAAGDADAEDRDLLADLLARAVACIKKAKETHDLMETYYAPNMDFAAIDALRDRILARVIACACAETAKSAAN